jgi:hypothetical protein
MKNSRILISYWQSLSSLTKKLLLFCLINTIVINFILIFIFSTPIKYTVLYDIFNNFLQVKQKDDSWTPMLQAIDYLKIFHQKPLYSEVFFDKNIKFQYPPTSLLFLYILKAIAPQGISEVKILEVLNIFSWISVITTVFFAIKIFDETLAKSTNTNFSSSSSKADLITRYLILACLSISFYPLIKAYSLGQIQAWINCIFTVLFWCWMKDKKVISGILAGTLCLIKPQYALIGIWGILRKQWIFMLAFIATTLTCLLISIYLFGFTNHINYLSVLSFISKHGEAYYHNHSVNGLLNRFFFNGEILVFQKNSFPPYNPLVYLGTTISSIALISLALFLPARTKSKGSIIDFSIIALTATMASPIAWQHHYGILLVVYAFLLPYLLDKKILGNFKIPYLCLSYLLSSNLFYLTTQLAYAPFKLNIVQSYLLAAAFMILALLYCISIRMNKRVIED